MIEWFARNPVAANLLMIGILFAGIYSASTQVPVEIFPSDEPDSISINTQFRGATPRNVEDGITLRIEEAIADIEGIEEIRSRSQEGSSSVVAEVTDSYDERAILDDIKVRVDALTTLPLDAERPTISLNTRERAVIDVVVKGEAGISTESLRRIADRLREGLLTQPEITNVRLERVPNYQINVDVSPETLDAYGLTLAQIGEAIRFGASDISAGVVQSPNGDILVRSNAQAYNAKEFASIPILASLEGKPITLGDIATIEDGFEDKPIANTFNGSNAIIINVYRVGNQSAIQVAKQTLDYMDSFTPNLPSGISIAHWQNRAEYLKSRMGAVLNSAFYGGLLVMLLLSLFLRPAVAFWVFLGIPVSFMGAFLFLPQVGGSFNVVSLFAFILVIGIVVDDAIVTGENIYRRAREGLKPQDAAIIGTKEIAVPVTFGVLTTAAAFMPLQFMEGTRFAFVASQMPIVVIPVLLMSLVESKLVLPSHLSHIQPRTDASSLNGLSRVQQGISRGLESFVEKRYRPFLERCLNNRSITIALLVAISVITIAALSFGQIRYSPFPRVTDQAVRVYLVMPESSGFATTQQHIDDIVGHFQTLQKKYTDPETGQSVITDILATAGAQRGTTAPNVGQVTAELQAETERVIDVSVRQISTEIRKLVGDITGAQSLGIRFHRGRFVPPINVELQGLTSTNTGAVVAAVKDKLASYPGVFDIQDNYTGGKEELRLQLKPRAYTLGLRLGDVAEQVRNAVFGYQAQRIQRDREELRVMVRYPEAARSSVSDLSRLPIRVPSSQESVLLSEIAEIIPSEAPSSLYRLNRNSIVNVTADVDTRQADAALVVADLQSFMRDLQFQHGDMQYRFDGDTEDSREANERLLLGLGFVLVAIYALLAIPFKSYGQPLVVMSIIPFGIIGAVLGHVMTGQAVTNLSLFGVLALIGVMVNDSLVLVDYINKQRARGLAVLDAVRSAACVRFRPVLLTSITTFAGLMPILLDGSQQAKWLKPMATSLGFGILFATVVTLIFVPVMYLVAREFKHLSRRSISQAWTWWLAFWNKEDERRV